MQRLTAIKIRETRAKAQFCFHGSFTGLKSGASTADAAEAAPRYLSWSRHEKQILRYAQNDSRGELFRLRHAICARRDPFDFAQSRLSVSHGTESRRRLMR